LDTPSYLRDACFNSFIVFTSKLAVIHAHYTTAPNIRAVPFEVLTPGGQAGNFWIHPRNYTIK